MMSHAWGDSERTQRPKTKKVSVETPTWLQIERKLKHCLLYKETALKACSCIMKCCFPREKSLFSNLQQ